MKAVKNSLPQDQKPNKPDNDIHCLVDEVLDALEVETVTPPVAVTLCHECQRKTAVKRCPFCGTKKLGGV